MVKVKVRVTWNTERGIVKVRVKGIIQGASSECG
jgi:hypothetical protein